MSSLVDEDGVVHEKGWGGQYSPKQGWFGPQKDTDFWGRPNVERGLFGDAQADKDWLGQTTKSNQGATLYRRSGGSSSRRSSSSGDGSLAGLVVLVIILALVIAFAAFLLLVVPLFIALQRGLKTEAGRRDWGIFALSSVALAGQLYLSVLAWNSWFNPYFYQTWQMALLPLVAILSGLGLGALVGLKSWLPPIWIATRHVVVAYGYGVREMWDKVWSWV